jgi:hypothetical protein
MSSTQVHHLQLDTKKLDTDTFEESITCLALREGGGVRLTRLR